MSAPYGNPFDPMHCEPEPVLAGPNEGPIGGGSWYAPCASCCQTTTHRAFTDEHGCELGGGCEVCRYIRNYRGCAYTRSWSAKERV